MSTQFDQVFDGLSKNSLTLADACRVLSSESQTSPESMRECCERIDIELNQGRISNDAAQLLLDALGERSSQENEPHPAEEVWVDVPLEPLVTEASRAPNSVARTLSGGDTITEVDLTMDGLLAALDRRSAVPSKPSLDIDFEIADELAAPVEWVEWEPEQPVLVQPPAEPVALVPDVELPIEAAPNLPATAPVDAAPEHSVAAEASLQAEPVPQLEPAAQQAVQSSDQIGTATTRASAVLNPGSDEVAEVEQLDSLQPEVLSAMDQTALAAISDESTDAAAPEAAIDMAPEDSARPSVDTAPESSVAVVIGEDTIDDTIDEVFAPRVEHVLKESLPMQPGALLKKRYRIVGSLAPGGLGQLFDAIDTQTAGAPRVTLKLIEVDWQEEPRAFETLQAIVRHVRRLRHPNILAILDIDRDDKHAIIAMEPLVGRWLSGLSREVRGRGLGFAVSWNIISGIANGLAYAHQHGAVHSELNPHMVFLTEGGGVKIVGFGLAHAMPMSTEPLAALDGLTLRSYADVYCATNWIHGSLPEGVDDLYPLGIIAYELLTGAHPFNRLSPAAAAAQQMQPSSIPGLDRRVRRVIERCLSFDRKERPVSGANFLAHIEPPEKLLDLVRERFKPHG